MRLISLTADVYVWCYSEGLVLTDEDDEDVDEKQVAEEKEIVEEEKQIVE